MADKNIVRKDIVQIGWDIDNNPIQKLNKEMEALKGVVAKAVGGNAFSEFTDNAKKAKESVKGIEKETKKLGTSGGLKKLQDGINKTVKSLTGGEKGVKGFATAVKNIGKISVEKLNNGLKKVGTNLSDIAKKSSGAAYNGLKKMAGVSFKALTAGLAAGAAAAGAIVTKSVQSFADYEQLVGGVDTLFGKASSTVQKNAQLAFKTAGLSANQYMETVTSFSASLIQSVGGDTAKAAEMSDTALRDMSDNANKMGTDMETIMGTYQSLAKGNFAMLDNLKLGYGGTKKEMERLVKDAAKIDKSVKSNDMSFGNMVKAIHAVQDKMGITGTTAKEASSTISGSLASMKASWQNTLTALVTGGDSFDQSIIDLKESIITFGKNIMPAIRGALSGLGTLVQEMAPIIAEELPGLAKEMIPPLISAAVTMVQGLVKALPTIISTLVKSIVDIFGEQFPALKKVGDSLVQHAGTIAKGILGAFVAFKTFKIGGAIASFFGKSKGGGKGGLFGGLGDSVARLGKTNTGTIAKGMANLAIIVGGMAILTAAVVGIMALTAKMGDAKTMIKMVGILAAVGLVGGAMAMIAGVVGNIPVVTVALGLANMAIIIAGMSALFLLIGATSLLKFDLGRVLHIVAIIGVLGTVGAAVTVFSGIAGVIPFPIVLAGLANIALVIGGMTALIVAYGALSKIPGFNDFITAGGATLANLFNQIGKIAGSLIGGLGEGITNSLPKIGENLSAFATSLQPLFSMFNGVDMSGVGSFFSAIGSFLLKMGGEKILSFFTGGTDLSGLGGELTTFATESRGFFEAVATFPAAGFTNATALFQALSDIGNVPKTGGFLQAFMGSTDLPGLASGLKALSDEGVANFFRTVATLPQEGFDKATALFQSISDIGNVPNTGGFAQWFSGENDFVGLAKDLPPFGAAMAAFYSHISVIDDCNKISELFKALGNIGKVPNEGGLWQSVAEFFGGENGLGTIGKELKTFGEDTASFFAQVNTLNVGNLNGLWESLKKPEEITTNISKLVDDNISDIVKKMTELPKKMGDGIKKSGNSLATALVAIWKDAVKATAAPVNKLIAGANWILKEFGADKKILSWTPYAKGTGGHKGGNALVNDGRGAELVQMPNGQTFIPRGKNVFIPNAPKGMKVLPAERTAQLMGKGSPTFRYADGTGDIDVFSYMDNPGGLIDSVSKKFVSYEGMKGIALHMGKGLVKTVSAQMKTWAKKLYDEFGAMSLAGYVPGKGVEQWRSTVIRALMMEGQYSAANVARTLYQMQTESGGNPRAINLWDSNAKKGIPSKGLMQVIDPTFKAYARPGFDKNIYDPLSNILASIRYAISRYGSLANAYRGVGYANGGFTNKPSIFGEDGWEAAIPLSRDKRKQGIGLWYETGARLGISSYTPESSAGHYSESHTTENNTYAPQFTLNMNGDSDRAMERKIKRWIQEAMDDVFDSMARTSPRIREV